MSRTDCEVCSGTGVAFGKVCSCAPIAPPASARPGCEACSGTGISWGKRCPCFEAAPPKPGDSIDTPLFRAVLRETFGSAISDLPRPLLASYIGKWADQRTAADAGDLSPFAEVVAEFATDKFETIQDCRIALLGEVARLRSDRDGWKKLAKEQIAKVSDYAQKFAEKSGYVDSPTAVMAGDLSKLKFWDHDATPTDDILGYRSHMREIVGPSGYVKWEDVQALLRPAAMGAVSQDAAVAAIACALDGEHCFDDHDAIKFLAYWNEGEFDKLRNNWPDLPEAVFIGADPLHPKTVRPTASGAVDLSAWPEEPTPEMQQAGATAIRFDTTIINKLWTANAVYRAMRAVMKGDAA